MNFGGELEGFKARYVKYSDKVEEHGYKKGDKYFGEWSVESSQPHGRYIVISKDGSASLGYYRYPGEYKVGNYIRITGDGEFVVGVNYLQADGLSG